MEFKDALQRALPGAEFRPQQEELAAAIAIAMDGGRHCLAEAGTGVGKTLAYLIPLLDRIADGERAIVSTFTLNLQSQLTERDLPAAITAAGCNELKWALLKGRANYLCLRRLRSELDLWGETDSSLMRLWDWAAVTCNGERSELDFETSSWPSVASERESCRGSSCPYHRKCFFFRAKRRAAGADLIIVNHALFFTDLACRIWEGESDVIPDYSLVIFDEAHHLEETAVKAMSLEASLLEGRRLLGRLRRLSGGRSLEELAQAGDLLLSRIYAPFTEFTARESFFFDDLGYGNGEAGSPEPLVGLELQIDELSRICAASGSAVMREQGEAVTASLRDYLDRLTEILSGCGEDRFRWGEKGQRYGNPDCALYLSPIRVGSMLQEHLFNNVRSAVLTSATLSALGSFAYVREALGLSDRVDEIIVGSPFNYEKQAILYLGSRLDPAGGMPGYHQRLAEEIASILEISCGRAFVLFTSYRSLNAVYDTLAGKLSWPLLRQGEMSNERLLEAFINTPGSCLFGTYSFWEGVDIPGEDLACVIIDRLPFSSPDDPLHRARVEEIKAGGGNWFMDYALPRAQIKLKQGLGRLIRSRSDRGIMAILDNRILQRSYGKYMLKDLPDCQKVMTIEDLHQAGLLYGLLLK